MNELITILDGADIDRILFRMAYEIVEIHRGTDGLVLIGIQRRGVHLAKRLQSKIYGIEGVELPTGSMDITMYRDDWTRISHHPTVQKTDIPFSVDGKQVIMVDDVLFTGRTVRAAMDAIMDFGRPDRIELAVLVERHYRELPIQANYIGKFIKTRRSETVNVLLIEQDGKDGVILN
jgi:pyrimidine operon attenuation protein/uracil phosphoribosyltransferase